MGLGIWNEASRIGLKIKKSLKRKEKSSGRDMESIGVLKREGLERVG